MYTISLFMICYLRKLGFVTKMHRAKVQTKKAMRNYYNDYEMISYQIFVTNFNNKSCKKAYKDFCRNQ